VSPLTLVNSSCVAAAPITAGSWTTTIT